MRPSGASGDGVLQQRAKDPHARRSFVPVLSVAKRLGPWNSGDTSQGAAGRRDRRNIYVYTQGAGPKGFAPFTLPEYHSAVSCPFSLAP